MIRKRFVKNVSAPWFLRERYDWIVIIYLLERKNIWKRRYLNLFICWEYNVHIITPYFLYIYDKTDYKYEFNFGTLYSWTLILILIYVITYTISHYRFSLIDLLLYCYILLFLLNILIITTHIVHPLIKRYFWIKKFFFLSLIHHAIILYYKEYFRQFRRTINV